MIDRDKVKKAFKAGNLLHVKDHMVSVDLLKNKNKVETLNMMENIGKTAIELAIADSNEGIILKYLGTLVSKEIIDNTFSKEKGKPVIVSKEMHQVIQDAFIAGYLTKIKLDTENIKLAVNHEDFNNEEVNLISKLSYALSSSTELVIKTGCTVMESLAYLLKAGYISDDDLRIMDMPESYIEEINKTSETLFKNLPFEYKEVIN